MMRLRIAVSIALLACFAAVPSTSLAEESGSPCEEMTCDWVHNGSMLSHMTPIIPGYWWACHYVDGHQVLKNCEE